MEFLLLFFWRINVFCIHWTHRSHKRQFKWKKKRLKQLQRLLDESFCIEKKVTKTFFIDSVSRWISSCKPKKIVFSLIYRQLRILFSFHLIKIVLYFVLSNLKTIIFNDKVNFFLALAVGEKKESSRAKNLNWINRSAKHLELT